MTQRLHRSTRFEIIPGPWRDLANLIPQPAPDQPLAVAFSGGLDSTALLHAAVARFGPARVCALHVNHHLQNSSDMFEAFCLARATELGCPFLSMSVDAKGAQGQSIEEAAREARYQALARMTVSSRASFCLLGQHADDQLETLILALSRGSGLAGLSGMGQGSIKCGARFERPWLGEERACIERAAHDAKMIWVEDPTNKDVRFVRNLVRRDVVPTLCTAFPQFASTAARSMRHCAEARELVADLADIDLRANPSMRLAELRTMSTARRVNLLRHWLLSVHQASPSTAQAKEADVQILATATGGNIDIACGVGRLVRRGDALGFEARSESSTEQPSS